MTVLDQTRMKRLTAVHGWSGVVLGFLLYAVLFTGAVAVVDEEIRDWSAGEPEQATALSGEVDFALRRLSGEVDREMLGEVRVFPGPDGRARIYLHTHREDETGGIAEYGVLATLDSETGLVAEKREGFSAELFQRADSAALADFIVDLHVQLYTPNPWGVILTGVLGLSMMMAGISGLLMHRHLIRDLFIARRPGQRLASSRDRHAVAGAWGLPFAFLLAFTGSFFSFATSVSLPVVAMSAFGGDREAVIETLIGLPTETDVDRAKPGDVDAMIAESAARAGEPAFVVNIFNYGRADAQVEILHPAQQGDIISRTHVYDGVTGAFEGLKPPIGQEPSLGGDVLALMAPLHFGNFGGLLSKIVWAALGAATCYLVVSGLFIWTRRRDADLGWRRFHRAVLIVAYGAPIGVLAAGYVFFPALAMGAAYAATPYGFLLGAGAAIYLGVRARDDAHASRRCAQALALLAIALPFWRMALGGASWAEALALGQAAVLVIDALLIGGGGYWLRRHWRIDARITGTQPAE